jgi:hypothetical protein
MDDTEIMAAPVITLPPPKTPTKFEREMAAFRKLMPGLLKDYRNKYVAIHEEQVVGSGDELIKVAFDAYDRFGYQPIYVDLVTDEPVRPERIPRFRILSSW